MRQLYLKDSWTYSVLNIQMTAQGSPLLQAQNFTKLHTGIQLTYTWLLNLSFIIIHGFVTCMHRGERVKTDGGSRYSKGSSSEGP